MEKLTFKIIRSRRQYYEYCDKLEELIHIRKNHRDYRETIALLTLLIEKWDNDHDKTKDANPVELLRFLMKENQLKSVDLAKELHVSPSLISDILNQRRGFSKSIIRKLSDRFKVNQELFNRAYQPPTQTPLRKSRVTG